MYLPDIHWPVALETITVVYEFQKKKEKCTENAILIYTGKTRDYVRRLLRALTDMNCLVKDTSSIIPSYIINSNYLKNIDGSKESLSYPLKESIITFKPFSDYIYYLSCGKTRTESIRLVRALYSIENDDKNVSFIFSKWFDFAKVQIPKKSLHIGIPLQLTSDHTIDNLQKALNEKSLALRFLREEFGDLYSSISENVINDLCSALLKIKIDTSDSINDSGRALEDFLRIDLKSGVDLTKCEGIGQIADEYNKFKKYPAKLNNIAKGLSAIRTMGDAHGADRIEQQRWIITEKLACIYILNIISLVKSYLIYEKEKRLEF